MVLVVDVFSGVLAFIFGGAAVGKLAVVSGNHRLEERPRRTRQRVRGGTCRIQSRRSRPTCTGHRSYGAAHRMCSVLASCCREKRRCAGPRACARARGGAAGRTPARSMSLGSPAMAFILWLCGEVEPRGSG
jgi:hypothetical protein